MVKLYLIMDIWKFSAQLAAKDLQPTGTTRTSRATSEIVSHHGHFQRNCQEGPGQLVRLIPHTSRATGQTGHLEFSSAIIRKGSTDCSDHCD